MVATRRTAEGGATDGASVDQWLASLAGALRKKAGTNKRIKTKKLQRAFQQAVEDLPSGALKQALQADLAACVAKLQLHLSHAATAADPTSGVPSDQADEPERMQSDDGNVALIDTVLPEAADHPETEKGQQAVAADDAAPCVMTAQEYAAAAQSAAAAGDMTRIRLLKMAQVPAHPALFGEPGEESVTGLTNHCQTVLKEVVIGSLTLASGGGLQAAWGLAALQPAADILAGAFRKLKKQQGGAMALHPVTQQLLTLTHLRLRNLQPHHPQGIFATPPGAEGILSELPPALQQQHALLTLRTGHNAEQGWQMGMRALWCTLMLAVEVECTAGKAKEHMPYPKSKRQGGQAKQRKHNTSSSTLAFTETQLRCVRPGLRQACLCIHPLLQLAGTLPSQVLGLLLLEALNSWVNDRNVEVGVAECAGGNVALEAVSSCLLSVMQAAHYRDYHLPLMALHAHVGSAQERQQDVLTAAVGKADAHEVAAPGETAEWLAQQQPTSQVLEALDAAKVSPTSLTRHLLDNTPLSCLTTWAIRWLQQRYLQQPDKQIDDDVEASGPAAESDLQKYGDLFFVSREGNADATKHLEELTDHDEEDGEESGSVGIVLPDKLDGE